MLCHVQPEAFPHNKVRDITASLLSEVCHNVFTEPHLKSANTDDNSRLDIAAYGLLGVGSIFMSGFLTLSLALQSTYRRHEQEKRRQYDQRIGEVEDSPLILSTTVGMSREQLQPFQA